MRILNWMEAEMRWSREKTEGEDDFQLCAQGGRGLRRPADKHGGNSCKAGGVRCSMRRRCVRLGERTLGYIPVRTALFGLVLLSTAQLELTIDYQQD